MKKILFFTVLLVVIACNKNTKENEEPPICCSPPPFFRLFIAKSAPEYQDFLNNKGEGDRDNVYFYQIVEDGTEKKISHNAIYRYSKE